MKKEIKTEITKEKIFYAALEEFGENGYSNASLNNICKKHNISKGLIYHNYENKQALYICCLNYAVDEFISYMNKQGIDFDIENYMKHRFAFFNDNRAIARLILEMLLQPPADIFEEFSEVQNKFNAYNLSIYKSAISKLNLREEVTEDDAIEIYSMFQTMLNSYTSNLDFKQDDAESTFFKHEKQLERILNYMLYGIAKEKD